MYEISKKLIEPKKSEEEVNAIKKEIKDYYNEWSLLEAIIYFAGGRIPKDTGKQHTAIYSAIQKYKVQHNTSEIGNKLDTLIFDVNGVFPYSEKIDQIIFFSIMSGVIKPYTLYQKYYEFTDTIKENILPKLSEEDRKTVEEIGGYLNKECTALGITGE